MEAAWFIFLYAENEREIHDHIELDNAPKLEGQTNYTVWEVSLRFIFKTLKL